MKNFWLNRRVLVTGGTGFIGSYVAEMLVEKGAHVRVTTLRGILTNIALFKNRVEIIRADLRDLSQALVATKNQEIVFHLASKVAGIAYNIAHQGEMFAENVRLTGNVIEACKIDKVQHVLIVSSACVYPAEQPIPTPESFGFINDPESTNLGYGWAKRVAELYARLYHLEYGMSMTIARPYNAYGPRDKFSTTTSHVIPALIGRVFSGERPLHVWGSGKQTRTFIYADDLARGLLDLAELYRGVDPINLGSNEEISIKSLAELIVKISKRDVQITFDDNRPDGHLRRVGDLTKAERLIGFKTRVTLAEGLQKTILWYRHHLLS